MASDVRTTIRYDGPALAGHEIDVQELAPALLALAEIIQIANRKFNGDSAAMRVLVKADAEQRCYQVHLHLVQSLYEQARTILGRDDIRTAKEIAEWVGLIVGPTSLFGLLAWLFGKRPPSESKIEVANGQSGTVIITRGDGNKITVNNHVYQLATDPVVQAQAKQVLRPLERKGYDSLDFLEGDASIFHIDKDEAREVIAVPLDALSQPEKFYSTVNGQVEIVTAQFKGTAQWGLWWTGRTRLMKIEDEDWLARFQAGHVPEAKPGAWLDVTMEIMQPRDRTLPASFVVRKINGVLPPELANDLFEPPN